MKIPLPGPRNEAVFLEPRSPDTKCAIHDWPDEGLAGRLIAAMREAHGKGGINACVDCIHRAKRSAVAK